MTTPSTITKQERDSITDANAHLFIARHVKDYFPCSANSEKLCGFIESQLGMPIVDFPYPLQLEQYEAAFEHIMATGWFHQRPEEVIEEEPAVLRERLAQQKVRDDYDAQQRAAKIARDKNVPLNQLRNEVGGQNKDFRQQRDANLLPTRATGMESRAVSTVTLGPKAQARVNVGNANPGLDIHSAEFTKLYAAELARLRG
jgi:hypothetical protein